MQEQYDDWDEDDSETDECPYCHAEIYADAERCPRCERYISDFDSPTTGQPKWIVVTALVLLIITLYSFVAPLLW